MTIDDLENEMFEHDRKMISNYGIWLEECLKEQNMQGLNSVIYQENRRKLVPVHGGGYDHCWWIWNILDAIACGDYDTVERRLPHELGLSKNGYPFYIHATNMFMGIWYHDEDMIVKALPKAEKFVSSKKPQWERAVISFLCNLYKNDIPAMEADLQLVCDSYGRQSIAQPMKKLCVNAYGLLILAYMIYPDLNDIKLPENKNFSKEYAKWRLDNRHPQLELYGLDSLTTDRYRKILKSPVAIGRNHQPYLNSDNDYMSVAAKKQWHMDGERMQDEFVNDINEEN